MGPFGYYKVIFNLYYLHVGRPVFKQIFFYMPCYMRLRHLVSSALAFAPGVMMTTVKSFLKRKTALKNQKKSGKIEIKKIVISP